MSFRHMKVHVKECFIFFLMILSDAKFEEQCICMFVVIEWEYNLILPVLFSIYRKQIQNCIL